MSNRPKLPSDFADLIAKSLDWKAPQVNDFFEFEETKDGFFTAALKDKKRLDPAQFKMLCVLTRDLGGEYIQGMRTWQIPGPLAKKQERVQERAGIDKSKADVMTIPPKKENMPYTVLPIRALLSMPFQSRTIREDPELDELAENIKALGILQPILVRQKEGGLYEIVYGERRVAAAKKAGLTEVPANMKVLSDQEAYEIQLVENVQRKDLSDMEKGRMLDFMIKKYGYTQEQLGKKVGKSQPWVSLHLGLLQIPESITRVIKHGELTEYQAREILSAPEEKREEILDKIRETGEVPTSKAIHKIAHPEEKAPTLVCAHCGGSVEHPVNLDGKFYCASCAEQVEAEKQPRLLPETRPTSVESERQSSPEKQHGSEADLTGYGPEPLLTGFEWTCPECGKKIIINHIDYPGTETKDHRLEACGQ